MIELLIIGGIIAALASRGGKSGSSAGSRSSIRDSARTQQWLNSPYEFDYRYVNGEWRAYIIRQPNYRGRPTDLHSTHRHVDSHGYYVCWSGPIRNQEECRSVAHNWARCTDQYIATGRRF